MWHYVRNGERVGPVNADEIERQIAAGAITADTLVWREGLADWMPAGATEWAARFSGMAPAPSAAPFAAAPRRPPSVTVFAILMLVFGGLALLCVPFSLWVVLNFGDQLPTDPLYRAWTRISTVLGLVAAIWQIIAGIGLLRLKRWARRAAVAYGGYAIVVGIIGMFFQIHLVTQLAGGAKPEMLPGTIGGIIGGVIGMAFPILLIVFLRKPRAVDACVN